MTVLYRQPYKMGTMGIIPRADERPAARMTIQTLTPRLKTNRAKRVIITASSAVGATYSLPVPPAAAPVVRTNQPMELLIIVRAGVTLSPGASNNTTDGMNLSNLPVGSRVTLINYGTIRGSDGWNTGGKAPANQVGGNGLAATAGTYMKIYNFGTIAAGNVGSGTVGVSAITNYRYVTLCVRGTITGALTA